jgi:hypothetical protein
MYDSYSYEFNYCSTLWFAGFIYRKNVGNFSLRLIPRKTIGEKHPLKPHLSCFLCFPAIDPNNIGHVHSAYNMYFSACFLSRNSVFLSQQINQQCFLAGLSAQPNGAIFLQNYCIFHSCVSPILCFSYSYIFSILRSKGSLKK